MTQHSRVVNRFEYHTEDIECSFCLRSKLKKEGS